MFTKLFINLFLTTPTGYRSQSQTLENLLGKSLVIAQEKFNTSIPNAVVKLNVEQYRL